MLALICTKSELTFKFFFEGEKKLNWQSKHIAACMFICTRESLRVLKTRAENYFKAQHNMNINNISKTNAIRSLNDIRHIKCISVYIYIHCSCSHMLNLSTPLHIFPIFLLFYFWWILFCMRTCSYMNDEPRIFLNM